MPINIVVVDDHTLFRKGMISILQTSPEVNVAGEAANGADLMKIMETKKVDAVLLDLAMPVMDGYEVLRWFKKEKLGTKSIVISMYDEDLHIAKAIEEGANGYLIKNAEMEEVIVAIQSINENGFYFNEKTSKAMLTGLMEKKKISPVFRKNNISFSDKEISIINLLIREHSSAEIGEKLCMSPRTVEGIRQSMIQKVGVRNVVGLILFAVKAGVINV